MKVYVDELPKDCWRCSYYHFEKCDLTDDEFDNPIDCHGEIMKSCPLQSLVDYTKQVRKEVCQEVLAIIDENFNCYGYVEEKFDNIKKYVEAQIQGETK